MRQPARISERLQRAGAHVEQRARIGIAADPAGGFRRVEQGYRRTALAPLLRPVLDLLEALGADGAMQRAVLFELAGDPMLVDQLHDQTRRIAEHIEQPLAIDLAENAGKIVGHHPHAGIDQADIAAGAAEADLLGFEQNDLRPGFRQMQAGGDAGIAAADDHHISLDCALKRHGDRRLRSGLFPEPVRARIIQHRSFHPKAKSPLIYRYRTACESVWRQGFRGASSFQNCGKPFFTKRLLE